MYNMIGEVTKSGSDRLVSTHSNGRSTNICPTGLFGETVEALNIISIDLSCCAQLVYCLCSSCPLADPAFGSSTGQLLRIDIVPGSSVGTHEEKCGHAFATRNTPTPQSMVLFLH